MTANRPQNILILSSGNAVRGIMLEAYINAVAGGRWRAFSAGTEPVGAVNSLALTVLAEAGIRPDAHSRSWKEYAMPGAPVMDVIVTVCSESANQIPSEWPGTPLALHWPLPHPSDAARTVDERIAAFRAVFELVKSKADAFLAEMHSSPVNAKRHGAG